VRCAVVLSTYNAPDRLARSVAGYAIQTHREFELVVADDGSTEETRALVDELRRRHGLRLRHVWQEDQGFRKCRILNAAIRESEADYLIFSDGDCIPRPDFVATHVRRARRSRFLSGGYYKLPMSTTERITEADVLAGRATDPSWLRRNGVRLDRSFLKLAARGRLAEWLNRLTPTRPSWNGHNASGWREDLLAVNGFDERMAYWAEDKEMGARLENRGVRGVQIRYSAICVHLEHGRPYVDEEARARNKAILERTRRERRTRTDHGIVRAEG
jgi:glycosyltransferase involved in cell wall biosynthesis